MGIKKFLRDVTGVTARKEEKLRQQLKEAEEARIKLEKANAVLQKKKEGAARKRKEQAEAKLTPKERATKKGEPWVDVIDFKINDDNIRNGFFELDWNAEFIVKLKNEGYGFEGDPEEEIVERWYRDICAHVAAEAGVIMESRPAGYLNVKKLGNGRAEVE